MHPGKKERSRQRKVSEHFSSPTDKITLEHTSRSFSLFGRRLKINSFKFAQLRFSVGYVEVQNISPDNYIQCMVICSHLENALHQDGSFDVKSKRIRKDVRLSD